MKRILITGKNSYVGNSFEEWIKQFPDEYKLEKISVRDDTWKKNDFSNYDVVLHVAGIAHRKETKSNKELYYRVNRDLTYEIAKKAKNEGVSQFIFLSSMSVYGIKTGVIDEYTKAHPKSNYGKSKLEAEKLLEKLQDNKYKICILRPPIIYGPGCNGNYIRLSKLAKNTPIFPDIENARSMLFINNLCKFINKLIDNYESGIFYPQNKEYVCTTELVRLIAEFNNKKIITTKLFNPLIYMLKIPLLKKVFGDLVYDTKLTNNVNEQYSEIDFRKTIEITEA